MSPVYVHGIEVEIPYTQIYTRLGYRTRTKVLPHERESIDSEIRQALLYKEIKAAYLRCAFRMTHEGVITLQPQGSCKSSSLMSYLSGCNELFVVSVTAGKALEEYRDQLSSSDELQKAVIADATGSELVEQAMNWIQDMLTKTLLKEGRRLNKRRFSPGYGDCSLQQQSLIQDLLAFNNIGITVSETYILQPEKSITAFIGITDRSQ